MRLDKYLKVSRVIKRRTVAKEICEAGRIQVNGHTAKAGHEVKPGDILDIAPQTAPIFLSIGMHCLGCPSSRGETVEEACMVHGVDVDKLLALVNEEANKAQ